MKLRTDLLKHLTVEDFIEEAAETVHRYKPEPLLSKTGTGSLSPSSTEERAKEDARNTALTRRLLERASVSGKPGAKANSPSANSSTS